LHRLDLNRNEKLTHCTGTFHTLDKEIAQAIKNTKLCTNDIREVAKQHKENYKEMEGYKQKRAIVDANTVSKRAAIRDLEQKIKLNEVQFFFDV